MAIQASFRLNEDGNLIVSGGLSPTLLGDKLVFEYRDFFNRPGLRNPEIVFEIEGQTYKITPRLVGRGWQATQKRKDWKLGINLFRVKNRSGRFAYTVWIEPKAQKEVA